MDSNYAIDHYGCWIWLGLLAKGYPVGLEPRENDYPIKHMMHRFMFEKHRGPIPEGKVLHHKCEVKRCINPDHLEPLTQSEHMKHHMTERNIRRRKRSKKKT